ncbi:Rv2578c family radical SAM protein [Lysinibacter sp. HNR]|uniref:Rv2578c family radical SAM protein n=1 Tax=Lysinibacter sp. HNR TaxID=3031408 RepID=UPI002435E76C|nr:Rv2578c family radical SAM protein [Lysinibacter sp. HNR]WGD36506.1 Rv2578c family radical SAM protein [Lysinibacter sp. HNR]
MRWNAQKVTAQEQGTLPGLTRLDGLVKTVRAPEFKGITFHEVLAKSALNRVHSRSTMPFGWTINPYRGCTHACVYCFARTSHTYLDLNEREDFDSQVIVKVNVVEVLTRELSKPSWARHPVALGTNTDPYQRAEGRYSLMPGIIGALANSGTSLSVLTKGTLLRRDLPVLVDAAASVSVDVAVSIAIFDDELQQSIEPGTPSTAARLSTVRAAVEGGLSCSVFMMPILPYLTDSREHLDRALQLIAESGATRVLYAPLHLRPGVKAWFMRWLEETHPELVDRYNMLYSKASAYVPREYREQLAGRIRPLMRDHGLEQSRERSIATPSFSPIEQPRLF